MSYLDVNRKVQDAIRDYLQNNLDSYASGVADGLPKLAGADFDDLGKDHILVYVPESIEDPAYSGTYSAQVMVRVATLRDTSITTHRAYCKAVFDLLSEQDLPTYINALSGSILRVNQLIETRSFSSGIVNESMRHDTMDFRLRVYQVTS